jgi:aryl-alcohol dehydrogenase-like predicted oxidoreductase
LHVRPRFAETDFRSTISPEWICWSVSALPGLAKLAPSADSISELALRYCLSFEPVSAVIPGLNSAEHLAHAAAAAAAGPLSSGELAAIDDSLEECYPPWASAAKSGS